MSILSSIVGFIPGLFKSGVEVYKNKQVIKAAKDERKHELKSAALTNQLEQIKRGSESDMKMDEEANGRIAWADDVSFAIFLLPAVLAFCPSALPHITAGFLALEKMPLWYQYALGLMLASVWGYRRVITPIIQMIAKAYLGVKTK